MSIFTKTGEAAAQAAQATKEDKASAHISFNSGTKLKVRFLAAADVVEYFAHSFYGKVDTFAPKVTPTRSAKGYITANPSLWDQASSLLYDDAAKMEKAGDEKGAEAAKKIAGMLKSKPRYLVGFVNLATGEQGFIDLTKKQQAAVSAALKKYSTKLDKLAFEIEKSGSNTETVVTVTPIIDMDEDLDAKERDNFAKAAGTAFEFENFEGFVYQADEAEQTRNLVIAGFDIARLGLSIGAAANVPADGPAKAAEESEASTQAEPDLKF